MKRAIYKVHYEVTTNGNNSAVSGYPKAFDSKNYDNDCKKALDRAYGEYHAALGAMYPRDDRQLQFAMIIYANTGAQIEMARVGEMAELPEQNEA